MLQLDSGRKGFAETAAAHRLVRRRPASDVERVEDIASRKVAVMLLRAGALKYPQIWRGAAAQRRRASIR